MKPRAKILLGDDRVREEIDRHKWFESEKAGYDIGYEKAAEDWLTRYADEWEQVHNKTRNGTKTAKTRKIIRQETNEKTRKKTSARRVKK